MVLARRNLWRNSRFNTLIGKDFGLLLTEKIVEQLAAVLVGMEAIVDIGLDAGVDVAIVELTVQDEEYLVCIMYTKDCK